MCVSVKMMWGMFEYFGVELGVEGGGSRWGGCLMDGCGVGVKYMGGNDMVKVSGEEEWKE